MKYRVSLRTMTNLISIAENEDDNPFGLTSFSYTQDLVDRIETALHGVDADTAVRLQASLEAAYENENRGRTTMHGDLDGLMVELIKHLGLDPLVVAWLARVGEALSLTGDGSPDHDIDVDPWTAPEDASCDTQVALGPDAMWNAAHGVSIREIPETVQAVIIGRPLRELLRHPVLDRHEITITGAESRDEGVTDLTVDYKMEMLEASDLFERRLVPA